jgi:mono/diheme cytochrome c family protein
MSWSPVNRNSKCDDAGDNLLGLVLVPGALVRMRMVNLMGKTVQTAGHSASHRYARLLMAAGAIIITGCGDPVAEFTFNRLYLERKQQETGVQYEPQQIQAIVDSVTALFGTPDEPRVQPLEGVDKLMNAANLSVASGPITSDNYGQGKGLYRQHCVHCHGITGNGRGPTAAFLNPYPRDFTRGVFKFKSTPIGYKPTHADLKRILENGIAGTAMPSFKLLSEGEVDALIEYVRYLAIRGEVERKLIEYSPDFFESDEPEKSDQLLAEFQGPEFLVEEVLNEVVTSWLDTEQNVTEIPERPQKYNMASQEFDAAELRASEERGRGLYYTSVANCFTCHGPVQLGDGQTTDYDNWSKEFFDWTLKNDPNYTKQFERYVSITGMPPRNIQPRNLRDGIYRGGGRPIDIFWRIHNGIDGTPMPAANMSALSVDDVWDIVNYVLSLPYDAISRPGSPIATNPRDIN